MSINWAEGPIRPHASAGPEVWVTPSDGKPYYLRCLGTPVGVFLHWNANEKRTNPCEGAGCKACPTCRQQWKGYFPAVLFVEDRIAGKHQWQRVVGELTENARDTLLADDFRPIVEWRGTCIRIQRVGKKVVAQVEDGEVKEELPPGWDVKPSLKRMWQVREEVVPSNDGTAPETIPFRRA